MRKLVKLPVLLSIIAVTGCQATLSSPEPSPSTSASIVLSSPSNGEAFIGESSIGGSNASEVNNFGYISLKKIDENNFKMFYKSKEVGLVKKQVYTNKDSNEQLVILSGSISNYPQCMSIKFKNTTQVGSYISQRTEENFFEFVYPEAKDKKAFIPDEINWMVTKANASSMWALPVVEITIELSKLL